MLPKTESPGRILCLLGMCVAFAGIGTGHLSRYFIYLDLFSHLTLHFAIAAIALGWAFLLPRHRLISAICLMLAGMVAIGMWVNTQPRVLQPRGTQEVPAGYRELRVMSFNKWIWNRYGEAVGDEIDRQDPDVVFLSEVTLADREMAQRKRERFPYQYPSMQPRGFRLYVMSRYELLDATARAPWQGPVFFRGSLGPAWGNLTLVGTHTIRAPVIGAQWK